MRLDVVEGPGAGTSHAIDRPAVIGRDRGCELVVDDEQASRRHARLTPIAGGLVLEDLGSRNGTWVDGAELHGALELRGGETVVIGATVLAVRRVGEGATPTAPRPAGLRTPPRPPSYVPPESVAAGSPLDPLLDIYTKRSARLAPLAIGCLAALAVIVFLAAR